MLQREGSLNVIHDSDSGQGGVRERVYGVHCIENKMSFAIFLDKTCRELPVAHIAANELKEIKSILPAMFMSYSIISDFH